MEARTARSIRAAPGTGLQSHHHRDGLAHDLLCGPGCVGRWVQHHRRRRSPGSRRSQRMHNLETAMREVDVTWDDIVRRTVYTTTPTKYETITSGIDEVVRGGAGHPAQTIAARLGAGTARAAHRDRGYCVGLVRLLLVPGEARVPSKHILAASIRNGRREYALASLGDRWL